MVRRAQTGASPRPTVRVVLADAAAGWGRHDDGQMAAAIAYYSALTLAPTLLLVMLVAGFFYDRATIAEAFADNLTAVLGPETVEMLRGAVRSLFELKSSGPLAFVGVVTLLFGATGLLLQVRIGLRRIWGSRPGGGFARTVLRERGIAVLALGALIGAIVLLVGLWWEISLVFTDRAGGLLQQVATAGLAYLMAAAAYRLLPSTRVSWRAVLLGAATATFGWLVASQGIGIYFSLVPTATLYGAASSLLVLLIAVYVGSAILLFGGEIARAYDSVAKDPEAAG